MRPRLELREEAHVLDGDHGLIGKGLEQLDLLAREWPWCRPRVDGDGSDGDAKAHHGHRQYASESSAPQAGELVVRVFEDIGYVDRLSGQNRPTADGTLAHGARVSASQSLCPLRARVVHRFQMNELAVEPQNGRRIAIAESRVLPSDGVE